MPPVKMRMPRQTRVKLRFQVMARWHLMAKRGKNALKLKTPSPALAKSSLCTRTLAQSPTLREDPVHLMEAAPTQPQGGHASQGVK